MKKNFKEENKLDDFIFKSKQVRLTMLVTTNYGMQLSLNTALIPEL